MTAIKATYYRSVDFDGNGFVVSIPGNNDICGAGSSLAEAKMDAAMQLLGDGADGSELDATEV